MTNPIPGADAERALFEAEIKLLRRPAVLNLTTDAHGDYADRDLYIGWRIWQARAAAKVGANVAADKMLSGALNHARETLRYYAEQEHFVRHQPDEWDTVSGEPESLYEDSHNTATVEDGTLAKNTLNDIAGVEAYASLAAGAPAETPKPVYLVRYTSIEGWRVASEEAYWTFSECNRRILYEAAHPAPIAGDVEKDAARWRALLSSARIRMIGSAGLREPMPNNYAHFGMEIWTRYGSSLNDEQKQQMAEGNALGRDCLTKYADIAIEDQRAAMLANSSSGEAV